MVLDLRTCSSDSLHGSRNAVFALALTPYDALQSRLCRLCVQYRSQAALPSTATPAAVPHAGGALCAPRSPALLYTGNGSAGGSQRSTHSSTRGAAASLQRFPINLSPDTGSQENRPEDPCSSGLNSHDPSRS